MASSRLSRSSTAHWVKTPPRPVCVPTKIARALKGALRATRTVVSTSAKPRKAASAASAARSAGCSFQLVTWAWLAGVRRTRIFASPIIISKTFMWRIISQSLAGVQPSTSRRTVRWVMLMSTNMRAICIAGVAIASSATARLSAWSAIQKSMASKLARALPSNSTTIPPSMRRLGWGS